MKIWLDDVRYEPEGWTWVNTVEETIKALETGEVEMLSLDNDLGFNWGNYNLEEGWHVARWMEQNSVWPEWVSVHSDNVVGIERMRLIITDSGEYGNMFKVDFHPDPRYSKRLIKYPAIAFVKKERKNNG